MAEAEDRVAAAHLRARVGDGEGEVIPAGFAVGGDIRGAELAEGRGAHLPGAETAAVLRVRPEGTGERAEDVHVVHDHPASMIVGPAGRLRAFEETVPVPPHSPS